MARFGSSTVCWLTAVFAVALWGCDRHESQVVSLERRTVLHSHSSVSSVKPLRLGMGAMITPKKGYVYYLQLKQYLEERLGRPVQLVDRDSYDQVSKLLEKGDLDAAFVCSGPYVEGHDRFGLELLAVPQMNGRTVYYSYIVVPKDSHVRDFTELRGKAFAFTDPKSNSGKLIPTYMLARHNETPERFFRKFIYTYGHDRSIKAVAEKMVDGAAVDSLIWDYMARTDSGLTERVRVVARSDPSGIPPLVVTRTLGNDMKGRLREALLSMHEDPKGKAILANMMIDRFVAGDDRNYDSIREMNAWIDRFKRGSAP